MIFLQKCVNIAQYIDFLYSLTQYLQKLIMEQTQRVDHIIDRITDIEKALALLQITSESKHINLIINIIIQDNFKKKSGGGKPKAK